MPMQARAQQWYAEERVQEPGSIVLRDWLANRPGAPARAGVAPILASSQHKLTDREAMAEIFALPSNAGPAVTATSAMQVTAVYACITLIAGAIASLPLAFYERTEGGGRKRIKHDYWWLFNEQPSPLLPAAVLWEYAVSTMYLHGDGLGLLVRNRNGVVTEVLPVSPLETDVVRERNSLNYLVDSEHLGTFGVHQDDMLHLWGFGFNGRRSMSIIRWNARQAIGTALAADEYSSRFFSSGAQPSHVIRFPGPVTAEAIDSLRKRWEERQAGLANSHKPLVLTNNAEVKELSIKPEDAQLMEARRFQVEDIARAFGVPPFMIGATEKTTSWGSGVEHMGQGFIRYILQRMLRRYEQELNRKLFRTSKYFCEFNVDGLQRGDLKTRSDYYRQARGGSQGPGWMTANEIRALENMEPIDGEPGNALYEPPAGALAPEPKKEKENHA